MSPERTGVEYEKHCKYINGSNDKKSDNKQNQCNMRPKSCLSFDIFLFILFMIFVEISYIIIKGVVYYVI